MKKCNSTDMMTRVTDIWLQLRETIGYTATVTSGERNHTQHEESRTAHFW